METTISMESFREFPKIQWPFPQIDGKHIFDTDSFTDYFTDLSRLPMRWTEKIDGENRLIYRDWHRPHIWGRTIKASLNDWTLSQYDLDQLETRFEQEFWDKEVYFYLENWWGKIQDGKTIYKEPNLQNTLLDIKIGNFWLLPSDVDKLAIKFWFSRPKMVYDNMNLIDFVPISKKLLDDSTGNWVFLEGFVWVAIQWLLDRNGRRIQCKIKKSHFNR
jgi:hypothetical protein